MEFEPQVVHESRDPWLKCFLAIILIVGALIAVNVSDLRSEHSTASSATIASGDLAVKQALSGISYLDPKSSADKAIDYYELSGNSPEALRRLGLAKEFFLSESGARDFRQLASPRSLKRLPKKEAASLVTESQMWVVVFTSKHLDRKTARSYETIIRKLDMGPLQAPALASLYGQTGEQAKAIAELNAAVSSARALFMFLGVLSLAGLVGLVLLSGFGPKFIEDLREAARPLFNSSLLLNSFLGYFLGFVVLTVVLSSIGSRIAPNDVDNENSLVYLLLNMVASLGAGSYGMALLVKGKQYSGEVLREIGLNCPGIAECARWGFATYAAAIPLVWAAAYIWQRLLWFVFKNTTIPEHPIVPIISEGGPLTIAFIIVLAVIVAPVIEELFFRGMLYTGLRGRMGVWPSAIISSAIFAAIHPTFPGQFLPLMVLAIVLAVVREKTQSLVPSIIGHALNNGAALVLAMLSS